MRIAIILFAGLLLSAALIIQPVIAAEPVQDKATEAAKDTVAASQPTQSTTGAYEYMGLNRRDPFTSLIEKKGGAKVKGRTPLESYETAEMRVIAILWTNKKYSAVLSMPDGKSYTAYAGNKVGVNGGHISKITNDTVFIADRVKDARGKLSPQERVLKLRMEEE
jgi:Tfp pilus assembly protein PilP